MSFLRQLKLCTEPCDGQDGPSVDIRHQTNLRASLIVILLVNTYGNDPEIGKSVISVPEGLQNFVEFLSKLDRLLIANCKMVWTHDQNGKGSPATKVQ